MYPQIAVNRDARICVSPIGRSAEADDETVEDFMRTGAFLLYNTEKSNVYKKKKEEVAAAVNQRAEAGILAEEEKEERLKEEMKRWLETERKEAVAKELVRQRDAQDEIVNFVTEHPEAFAKQGHVEIGELRSIVELTKPIHDKVQSLQKRLCDMKAQEYFQELSEADRAEVINLFGYLDGMMIYLRDLLTSYNDTLGKKEKGTIRGSFVELHIQQTVAAENEQQRKRAMWEKRRKQRGMKEKESSLTGKAFAL